MNSNRIIFRTLLNHLNHTLYMKQPSQLVLLIIVTIISCKSNTEISDVYVDRFYKNQAQANELVKLLRFDSSLEEKSGEVLNSTMFNEVTKKRLAYLGIDAVHLFAWIGSSRPQLQFDFITNWRKENFIHLTYNSLDSISTLKGFYRKDKNSNEFWGLGENWTLWIERKLLEKKQ